MPRAESLSARLARLGVADVERAAAVAQGWVESVGEDGCQLLLDAVGGADDPDWALAGIARLADERPGTLAELTGDPGWLRRVARVLGASLALGRQVAAHPQEADGWRGDISRRPAALLRRDLLEAVGADAGSPVPVADPSRADDLRDAYRRALARIVARDTTAADPLVVVDDVAGELADLADAVVETGLALARGQTPGWELCRLGVVALGKAGAGELNYVSDVDVLYVAEPADGPDGPLCDPARAVAVGAALAGALHRICSARTAAGTIWPIDPNLRPEGQHGPLVRTMASHRAYYEKWAKGWEFQAMLKARPMAGDLALAGEFVDLVWPMVWSAADDAGFVHDVQAMRQRVISLLPAAQDGLEIKLGAGGLRDIEFSVQLLQLVHGRADERLRLRGTFGALEALVAYGYVGRLDGTDLEAAYRLERVLEHRVQLAGLRRTHLMPSDEPGRRRLARSIGLSGPDELDTTWRATTRRVLALRRHVFFSPILEAVARIPSAQVRLTSQAAETRLAALGYGDPAAALRHIEALSQGMSRRAEIQRQILPVMLGWFAGGPNPDYGLLAFRQVSDALGSTPWYLAALRDGAATAEQFAKVLSSSRYAVDLLLRNPQSASLLGDPAGLAPRSREAVLAEMRNSARRHERADDAAGAVRAVRRSELLRLAMADLIGDLELADFGRALTDVASATIDAALEVAGRGLDLPPLAVVAMGRWGGRELSYASDADAMVVIADDASPGRQRDAATAVSRLRLLLGQPGPDPVLAIDLDLRPEGKNGPTVRTLSAYAAYYQRWASTWEAQALLRADVGAGDRDLAAQLLCDVVDAVRYPAAGLAPAQVSEIRKLKARMEAERMPRGADPSSNVKLGPGGLSDVEWVVQLLQLRHAGTTADATLEAGLRGTTTLGPLAAARDGGLLDAADADILRGAWTMASKLRNAIMLARGRASDVIPPDARDVAVVAGILGYGRGEVSAMLEEHSRLARAARQVMERVFWE